jgi:RNA polymerase sigma-70 factor (ECF subfamily)
MKNSELFALVEKAMKGDRAAFEALYTSHITSIIFGVRNWLYDKKGVDDAASEVVLHMYRSIARLQSPYAFKPWMQKIIINTCMGLNNRAKRDDNVDISEYEMVLVDDDIDIDPEMLIMTGDEDSDINTAIQALPPSQRRTLILFYYEDMSYQEIAEALGVSESTVATNLMKARKNLKGILEMKGTTYPELTEVERKSGFGLAVTSAIGADVNKTVSSSQVDNVLKISGGKLNAYYASTSTSSKVAMKIAAKASTLKMVLLGVACTLIVAGCVAFTVIINAEETHIDKEIAAQTEMKIYEPAVTIVFSGSSDTAEHINPTSATLTEVSDRDTVSGWSIYNEENEEVSSGAGAVIENAFKTLSPGNYKVSWILTTETGERAKASRGFTIQ